MADGSELATLSNVSKAFGLSANTSAATGNELVTLSNIKALLENGGGGGGSSIDGYSWSELSQMSKEVQTLGVTAFREKYKDFLWKTKLIEPSTLGRIKDNYTNTYCNYTYATAILIGLAHDPLMNANYNAGFTFAFFNSYPMGNGNDGGNFMVNGNWTYRGSGFQKRCEALYYTMADADLKNCLVPVEKVNYPDANSFDYFFPMSSTEFGFDPDYLYDINDDSPYYADGYTYGNSGYTYEVFDPQYATEDQILNRQYSFLVNVYKSIMTTSSSQQEILTYRDFAVNERGYKDLLLTEFFIADAGRLTNSQLKRNLCPKTSVYNTGMGNSMAGIICFNI